MVNGGILPPGATRVVPDRFAGRVALVTGSTQGLGETLARRLVAEGLSGLVVTGRNAERGEAVAQAMSAEQRHDGSTCEVMFHPAALDDAAEVEGLLAAAKDRFGTVHHLANCAAFTERMDIWESTPEFHDQMMAVNLRAPLQLMQGVAEMLRDAGQPGSIDSGLHLTTRLPSVVDTRTWSGHGDLPSSDDWAVVADLGGSRRLGGRFGGLRRPGAGPGRRSRRHRDPRPDP